MLHQVAFLPAAAEGSSFATPLPAFAVSMVTAILIGMGWKLKVGFVLISPCLRILLISSNID